ncbi:MAG: tetratricopeptide repeat protein [Fibrobacteres bacterium]|nr:tetratricopeptide repeat protein [Fibrobacterota bacterium]
MKKITKILLFSFVVALFGVNCGTNIFQAPDSMLETSAEGLVQLGDRAKRNGNNELALEYYTRAIKEDPNLSDAWYLQAEMFLLTAKPKPIMLPDLISELVSENSAKLPFFPDSSTKDSVLRYIEVPNVIGTVPYGRYDSLYDKLSDLYRPSMRAYNSLLRIYGDGTDTFKIATKGRYTKEIIRIDFTMLSALRTAMISLDQNMDTVLDNSMHPVNNRERKLYKLMAGGLKNINSVNINVDSVKQLFDGPSDINGMIDNLIGAAGVSLNAITDTKNELAGANIDSAKKAMMDDPQKQMQTIIAKAGYFYYTDLKDNDSSYYKTPSSNSAFVQKMIWIDTNGNDQIDWVDPNDNNVRWNLSDIISKIRKSPTRKKGRTALGFNPSDSTYDSTYFTLKITPADTNYIFKGTHGGEFVAGNWGIDEEQLDDKDNDGDGLKDEDTRMTSDTLDQDFDFIKIDNRTSDATGNITSGKRSLDIIDSTLKYTAKLIWDDLDGDGKIDAPGGGHIHIDRAFVIANKAVIIAAINAGTTGYGEWKSGDWGIDEEYQDGRDNDEDGKIDEDGDVHRIHLGEPTWNESQRANFIQQVKTYLITHPENINPEYIRERNKP